MVLDLWLNTFDIDFRDCPLLQNTPFVLLLLWTLSTPFFIYEAIFIVLVVCSL
jgi:hypothetical protein